MINNQKRILFGIGLWMCASLSLPVAAETGQEMAKELSNPVAALISVPIQYNYDRNIGPADGKRSTLNIQPVMPFELNKDWNLISRTILPVIDQQDVAGRSGGQSGIGDITQSVFLSPAKLNAAGVIWGVGPAFLLPTASDDLLGGEKWGAGPTGVALVQKGAWTVGALANHIWSFAGKGSRADISTTFVQPFIAYILPTLTTISMTSESSYNWKTSRWSVPINLGVSQLFKVGNRPMSLGVYARYWAMSPRTGADGWGYRVTFTLLFPRSIQGSF